MLNKFALTLNKGLKEQKVCLMEVIGNSEPIEKTRIFNKNQNSLL